MAIYCLCLLQISMYILFVCLFFFAELLFCDSFSICMLQLSTKAGRQQKSQEEET